MKSMDRRRFLIATAATATLPSFRALAQATTPTATLKLHTNQPGAHVPANFIGLSYETNQLTDPSFFNTANSGLIAQFHALAPHGVLRIGGNTSDIGWWKPTPTTPQPEIHVRDIGGGEPTSKLAFSITPEAIHNLRAFLDTTGWTCIYGINLGTNTPARAAEEAVVVNATLGHKLEYFQLGNEPDLYKNHLRDPKTWSADLYMDEWLAEANAIRARVPSARFGLPDTGGNPEWYAVVVTRLLALSNPPDVAALTHHYYAGGPPSNPKLTIGYILSPNPQVVRLADDIRTAADRLSAGEHRTIPHRMTEGNTCYRGGKPGVSDVFAASLWAADYLLQLASFGYAGVNLHGGDGKAVGNSLGGHLPGDDIVLAEHGDPSKHPHPYYTPIAHIGDQYLLEPVAYGMLFAGHFAGATMLPLDFNPGSVNATAYAAKTSKGQTLIAIINKDESLPLTTSFKGFHTAAYVMLTAPSLTSTKISWNDKNLSEVPHTSGKSGSKMFEANGRIFPNMHYVSTSDADLQFEIPPATAVLIGNIE